MAFRKTLLIAAQQQWLYLQLSGPSSVGVGARSHSLELSVPSFQRLLVRVAVFCYAIGLIMLARCYLVKSLSLQACEALPDRRNGLLC